MTHAAWSYWKRDGSPLPGTREAARTLDQILSLDPNHPGAVHLYIHLFESSAAPERALPQADRLESLMPKAGHMVHMPSHIYVRTGDYEKALTSNQRSLQVDGVFQKEWGDRATPNLGTYGLSSRTHARHAWDFIRYAAVLAGNYARAMEAARATAGGPTHQGMGAGERAASMPWLINKTFGKWDAVLAEPEPAHGSAYLRGLWHYTRGSAFAAQGKLDKAEEEWKAHRAASVDPSVKEMLAAANPAPAILELSALGLEGELLSATGRHDEAVKKFEAAVRLQDTLKYIEPPDWGQSMRLYLGAALLKAGRAREAERVYREDLKDFRNNGWTLFGLAQSLRAQGKSAAARKVEEQFQRAWRSADVKLKASVF
jgi:tetratricopeptide (TPR) repeat protein